MIRVLFKNPSYTPNLYRCTVGLILKLIILHLMYIFSYLIQGYSKILRECRIWKEKIEKVMTAYSITPKHLKNILKC